MKDIHGLRQAPGAEKAELTSADSPASIHRFAVRVPPPLGAGRNHSFLFSILSVMWYY